MVGRRLALGGALVGVLLASSVLLGEQQQPTPKAKTKLPLYWSKLGLSDEQKKKVVAIQADYGQKIDVLKKDISRLEEDEKRELGKILTDPQKEELKKIISSKALGEPTPDAKTPKDTTKPKDQKKPGDK